MSDIKLFRLQAGRTTELQGDASDPEKPLQTLPFNSRAHRRMVDDPGLALQEFLLLNLLYTLERSAVARLEDPPEQECRGAQK